ncbi:hypothetical protein ABIB25_005597 [Nakamurella sp. UYEF19]
MAITVSVLVGIGVLFGTIGSASAEPSAGDWQKLRNCESGGNYAINTGNGYYGAYQFDLGTWRSVGGSGLPSDASPATQDALAYKLWQQRGWSPWACASIVGLPAGGSGGPAPVRGVTRAAAAERTTGHYDSVKVSGDGAHLTVTGWAADLSASSRTVSVRITVDGVAGVYKATVARSDVNQAKKITGNHGFVVSIPAVAGDHRVCVTALGKTAAHNASLACHTARVPGMIRASNAVTRSSHGRVVVSGWAYDNTSAGRSLNMVVTVDNKKTIKVAATRSSGDLWAALRVPGHHRYATSVWLGVGKHSVCASAIGVRGNTKFLGCSTVNVASPRGYIQTASGSAGKVKVSGWGFDPNQSSTSVRMQVVVNGTVHTIAANQSRSDVDRAFGITGKHGYSATFAARKGFNRVCVYTMGTLGIAKSVAGCRNVTA